MNLVQLSYSLLIPQDPLYLIKTRYHLHPF